MRGGGARLGKQSENCLKSFYLLSLKLMLQQEFKSGLCFSQMIPIDSQKPMNNKQLPWKQNKRYLIHFTFSESQKSTANSIQNFMSLISSLCWETLTNSNFFPKIQSELPELPNLVRITSHLLSNMYWVICSNFAIRLSQLTYNSPFIIQVRYR